MASNGFGESYDEAKEVFTRIGVVEATNIIGGLNFFRWGLEIVRRGNDRDSLSLWYRSQNDSAL